MKLQNLIIIFLAIALPVILILSIYVGLQVDTASLKANYNDYLVTAAHEAILAFQINTKNNTNQISGTTNEADYSQLADTKQKDIEAAINVFSSSLASSFGRTGTSKSFMMTYVPAVVFTLYDGYYIYSPTEKVWENVTNADVSSYKWVDTALMHELKPYVYYSRTYKSGENKVLTINYSLDNYVTVYYYNGENYISNAGYLEIEPTQESKKQEFLSSLTDDNARNYYKDAWEFTKAFNDILNEIGDQELKNKLIISKTNTALPRRNIKL